MTRTQDRRHTDTAAIQLMEATAIQPTAATAATVAPWSSEVAGAVATTMEAIGVVAIERETTMVAIAPEVREKATEVEIRRATIIRRVREETIER